MSVRTTALRIAGMDCPAEEQLVRLALRNVPGVTRVRCAVDRRLVVVDHHGDAGPILEALRPLRLGVQEVPHGDFGPGPESGRADRSALWIVLAVNAGMFVVEAVSALVAHSAGLLADSLDMLADAAVYGVALIGAGAVAARQNRAARLSGWLQLALASMVLAEVVRRAVVGATPSASAMIAVGALALVANTVCVIMLAPHRRSGVHMRASWIFTANDTLANLGVIAAGGLVALTGSAWPDLLAGLAIAVLVGSGAVRILRMTRGGSPG